MLAQHPLLRLIIMFAFGLSLHFPEDPKNLGKTPNFPAPSPHQAAESLWVSPGNPANARGESLSDLPIGYIDLDSPAAIAAPDSTVPAASLVLATAGAASWTASTASQPTFGISFQPLEREILAFAGHPLLIAAQTVEASEPRSPQDRNTVGGTASDAGLRQPRTGRLITPAGDRLELPVIFISSNAGRSRATWGSAPDGMQDSAMTFSPGDPVSALGAPPVLPWLEWSASYRIIPDPSDGGPIDDEIRPFYLLDDPGVIGRGRHEVDLDGSRLQVTILDGAAAAFDPADAWLVPATSRGRFLQPPARHPLSCFRRMLLNRRNPALSPVLDDSSRARLLEVFAPADTALEAFGRQLALRFRLGLMRLHAASWGVADALEETLIRHCFDGPVAFAAWPASPGDLAVLEALLLDSRLLRSETASDVAPGLPDQDPKGGWDALDRSQRDVVGRILDWIESQPDMVAWVESDAGDFIHLAIANLTREPMVAALQWSIGGGGLPPVGVMVDPQSVVRTSLARPHGDARLAATAGGPDAFDSGDSTSDASGSIDRQTPPGGGADAALRALRESGFIEVLQGSSRSPDATIWSRSNDITGGTPEASGPAWAAGPKSLPRPIELVVDADRGRMSRLLIAAPAYPVVPPGAIMNRFVRGWTLEAWRRQAVEVTLGDTGFTTVTLQRSIRATQAGPASGWELFIECEMPNAPAPGDEPRDVGPPGGPHPVSSVEHLPGHEAVTLFIGGYPHAKAILAVGPDLGTRPLAPHPHVDPAASTADPEMMFGAGAFTLTPADVRRTSAGWRARVEVPPHWFEGPMLDIGVVRTHGGRLDAIASMPRPVLPWRIDPGRVRFDVSTWPALPQQDWP